MECFPCSPQVFFPLHVQSIWLEQVFEPVLKAWKNPRNTPRPTSQPSKSSKHTAWSSLLSSLELLSNLSVVVVIAFAHCNNIKKKEWKKENHFSLICVILRHVFDLCTRRYVYAEWNLVPSIPCKNLDVIFFSVTFSLGENETWHKFTSGGLS